jgi:hypothetical protein
MNWPWSCEVKSRDQGRRSRMPKGFDGVISLDFEIVAREFQDHEIDSTTYLGGKSISEN